MIPPCLTLSNIRYVSRVKWINPGKGVVPFPTPRCSSYWKGSLLVTLNYGCQLTLFIFQFRPHRLILASFSLFQTFCKAIFRDCHQLSCYILLNLTPLQNRLYSVYSLTHVSCMIYRLQGHCQSHYERDRVKSDWFDWF